MISPDACPVPRRPADEKSGVPFVFDVGCLTAQQRALWDQTYADLKQWADGTTWQVTLMELWAFNEICMFEGAGFPDYTSELLANVGELNRMLAEYRDNVRRGHGRRKPGAGGS